VAQVFTPKDFGLTEIMGSVVDVIRAANDLPAHPDEKVREPA
jgi:(2R)-ethylmalonyl-CoA mutase